MGPLRYSNRYFPATLTGLAACALVACGSEDDPEPAQPDTRPSAAEATAMALGTTPDQVVSQLLTADGAAPTQGTRNLFTEVLGVSEQEVKDKLATAISRFFGIGTDEPNSLILDEGYRVYYELPQDRSRAFIWAADSDDVRSEGMSYGMMLAVQVGLREHFDRLWNFTKAYLQYPSDSSISSWRHYFKWQGRVDDANPDSWSVVYGPTTVPAPDGEEYFAAALYLADRRWGSDGAINYRAEADALAAAMLNNASVPPRHPIIHQEQNMVVFVPFGDSNTFSDPSYHLPAFYELFAIDGPAADAQRWLDMAEISRQFFVDSAHPSTGLHPDYANFDGTPNAGGDRHDEFRYDAWRVVMNMAVDYAWFSEDARLKTQIEKYHAFFEAHLSQGNVTNALFALDGSNPEGGSSTALTAALGSGALASEAANRQRYVENAWLVGQQSGQFRYYQQCVYLLAMLAAAGHYGYEWGAGPQ